MLDTQCTSYKKYQKYQKSIKVLKNMSLIGVFYINNKDRFIVKISEKDRYFFLYYINCLIQAVIKHAKEIPSSKEFVL